MTQPLVCLIQQFDDANQATNRLYLFMVIGAGLVAAVAAVWARRQHTRTFASKRVVRARWAVVQQRQHHWWEQLRSM